MTLSILLIGSGAREVAIAKAIKNSNESCLLANYANHKNPQLQKLSKALTIADLDDSQAFKDYLNDKTFDYAVIGPENPLSVGFADLLEEKNIPTLGPLKALAKLESSKHYARTLLKSHLPKAIPDFHYFDKNQDVQSFLKTYSSPFVIKADGLMGGKGVFVEGEHFHTFAEALSICNQLQKKEVSIIIEEKLVGEEFSLLSFSDGKTLKHMPLVQDNKRAFNDDKGPNTGGMGSISYANHKLPFLSDDEIISAQKINEKAIRLVQEKTGLSYKGILYGGFMKTPNGIKLIEFNCRFGCPEAINLLPLLKTSFIDILNAIKKSELDKIEITFENKATVCKYVVPNGYPDNPIKDEKINANIDDDDLFFASVDENLKLLGSRAIAVLGIDKDLEAAEQKAEVAANSISGPVFYRNDIGTKSLIDKRLARIKVLCHAP